MKTAIIYHRVDWDGYTSAAVALRAFPDADLIGWNYRDSLPVVDCYDTVILVDLTVYSVNPDKTRDFSWMLNNQSKLIWIDHHPIINDVPGEYRGIQEQGIGACWLTWKYFHDNYGISCNTSHIKYAATYDVFRKDGLLCTFDDAWAYQLYLNRFGPGWTKEEGDVSKKLVETAENLLSAYPVEMEMHLRDGEMFEFERACAEKNLFEKHAYRVKINGHEGWLVEANGQPSILVKDHCDACDGDFFIIYSEDKKKDDMYTISIRVPDNSHFSAKAFAEAHGGGGHERAAGCSLCEDELSAIWNTQYTI